MNNIDELAKIIWDYHNIRQNLEKSDLIFVLCSNDIRIAEYACDLYLQGYAPFILFSGGLAHQNDILKTNWNIPEADKFAEIAIKRGIPEDKIITENKAANTGENFIFSCELLKQKGIEYKKIILVQKPFMLRRTYATFAKQWPGEKVDVLLTSPPISFQDYSNETITKDVLKNTLVGDLERIKVYPEKGFQIYQDIPGDVWSAFNELVKLGYTKHLIRTH
ncbi:MAG TPA: YdcF family protein [Patescibacteria group bacterium]|nr:YdcF family protein [Patescibacteria group bacterium]